MTLAFSVEYALDQYVSTSQLAVLVWFRPAQVDP